jgi:hypothetical protein
MTVLKTALVAALLLLAAAAAAQTPRNYTIYNYTIFIVDSHDHGEDLDIYALQSVGPYDYDPYSTVYYYLLWFPPHAVPMNLRFLNVTWWKPETIWLVGTYFVRVSGMGCVPATIYVVQDGVRMNPPQVAAYLCRTRRVACPAYMRVGRRHGCPQQDNCVEPHHPAVDIRRLLPIRQQLVLAETTAVRPQRLPNRRGGRARQRRAYMYQYRLRTPGLSSPPAGTWIQRRRGSSEIPNDTAVMAELQRLRMRVSELEAELANKTAQLAQLNATAAQLNLTVAQLNAALARGEGRGGSARGREPEAEGPAGGAQRHPHPA